MTIQEFSNLVQHEINLDDYRIISLVLKWHPCICVECGEDQVVRLYKEFGMQIFRDMLRTAHECMELHDKIEDAKNMAKHYQHMIDLKRPKGK